MIFEPWEIWLFWQQSSRYIPFYDIQEKTLPALPIDVNVLGSRTVLRSRLDRNRDAESKSAWA